jgi:hypothetical protein
MSDALARLRGSFRSSRLDARRIASTVEQPGCGRRTLLDAAHVHLNDLAQLLGAPEARQSPFAITRGNAFERNVMADGMAGLLAVLRARLGMAITEVRQIDLSAEQVAATFGRSTNRVRARLTLDRLREMLVDSPGSANLLRHPLFAIEVAGVTQYVEADVLAFVDRGSLQIVEIKSFMSLDGRPDPAKVADAARQSAVYVIAMQDAAVSLGFPSSVVATRVLLVLPRDFTFQPDGHIVEVVSNVRRLRRQLSALPDASALADALAPGVSLPSLPTKGASAMELEAARIQAAAAVGAIDPRFGDGCTTCPLFRFCRDESRAAGSVAALGSAIAADLGDVTTIEEALALARGERLPSTPAEQAVQAALGAALDQLRRLEAG